MTKDVLAVLEGIADVAEEVSVGLVVDRTGVHNRMVGQRCSIRTGRGRLRGQGANRATTAWKRPDELSTVELCAECTWDDLELGELEGGSRAGVDLDRNTFTQKSARDVALALAALREFARERSTTNAAELFDRVEELERFSSVRRSVALRSEAALDVLMVDEEVLRRKLAVEAAGTLEVPERLLGPAGTAALAALRSTMVEELTSDASWSLSTADSERVLLRQVFRRGRVRTERASLSLVPTVAVKVLVDDEVRGTASVRFETKPSSEVVETVAALFDPYGKGAFTTLAASVEAAEELL